MRSALSDFMVKANNSIPPGVLTAVRNFMKLESAGGVLLLAAAAVAMLVANSPLAALYFSVVTSSTLGYGDITLTGRWQLLANFEAMGGLILFGASTAFLNAITRSWFSHLSEPES